MGPAAPGTTGASPPRRNRVKCADELGPLPARFGVRPGTQAWFLTPITSRFVSKDPPKRLDLDEKLARRRAAARRRRTTLAIGLACW